MGKTESMTCEIEKNHGLYDNADNTYSFHVQIQNYDLLKLCLIIPAP